MADPTYRVIVTREGSDWLADVPDLSGAHTFARSLAGLDRSVREVVVLAADLPDEAMDSLQLDFRYRTGNSAVDTAAVEVRTLRAEADSLVAEATQRTTESAQELAAQGFSVRDIAAILGISPQRVSQITARAS